MKHKLIANKKSWDVISHEYAGGCALPIWGPYDVGNTKDYFKEIKKKSFLELACGSGHSIEYLIKQGASRVVGVDLSTTQVDLAKKLNKKYIDKKSVSIYQQAMEEKLPKAETFDAVFSIYGLSWSTNPKKVFKNVYNCLKPGGRFVWSVDHKIFRDTDYKNNVLTFTRSYHDEKPVHIKNWRNVGDIHFTLRKTSTWFNLLEQAGFDIILYDEPKPKSTKAGLKIYTNYKKEKVDIVPTTLIFVCQKPKK